ncbi:glycosyltransferase [Rhodococcus sp. SORGH_AS_0301]|uniref:glycosyltransferase n=1 Tax=Rhodococcus sp. SORGH_AS_0301 TaxID=3041780 RepID=UPI00278A017A|nr:glycosyltransferase [Rhodococcus sp. SORGH_AS_0301]MDQ1181542.1 UDP-N-acetylglucosamine--N-acetylmuramyl-(pentapeptide) pyrophosphoryl-undecaprenol N-acetylglucosamine transferase [Rhodococcus sp. SORGH_AS_0301]
MTDNAHPLAALVPAGARVLWVASSGGHFAQLARLAAAVDVDARSDWITFDTPQTRGASLATTPHFVPYIAPRDWKGVARAAARTSKFLRGRSYDLCISTGSALALGVLPVAAAHGVPAVYIESISRVHGPSVTGRALRRAPGVTTYTQHASWASEQWPWAGSVLDTWSSTPKLVQRERTARKIFVTLGTIRPYRFDRAVDAVLDVTTPDDEIVWQLGCTTRDDLRGEVHHEISPESFAKFAHDADVTVTHAGVGSLMQLLDMGITPSIVVREPGSDEHVDDHQRQIAEEMKRRNLAFELDLSRPSRSVLERSAHRTVLTA